MSCYTSHSSCVILLFLYNNRSIYTSCHTSPLSYEILHVKCKTSPKPKFKIQPQIRLIRKIMLQLSDRIAELVSLAHVGIVNSFSISNQEIKAGRRTGVRKETRSRPRRIFSTRMHAYRRSPRRIFSTRMHAYLDSKVFT
jgi:hypothetical protein